MADTDLGAQRVLTLITNPDTPCLDAAIVDAVRDAVGAKAAYFLADGIACDIPLPQNEVPHAAFERAARSIVTAQPIDVVVQDADIRRKSVLLADMDSTLIHQECIDELAAEAGVGEPVAAITAKAMAGELNFEAALTERVALLRGMSQGIINKVLDERITLVPGGRELVATMKAHGGYCALVSGGFTQFTGAIAQKLGFDEHRANTFAFENDLFTGTVVPPILGREAKVDALVDVTAKRNVPQWDVMAVGDGANDLGMLGRAGSGVALHAKPVVAEAARIRIDHGDLTALLYIQGYRKTDFAT
ncbi:MAG: phosphoserine phosphatase SerB [Pseudomonadota bacterium]